MANGGIEVGKVTPVKDREFPEPYLAILLPKLDEESVDDLNGVVLISGEFLGDSDLAEERRIKLKQVLEQLAESL